MMPTDFLKSLASGFLRVVPDGRSDRQLLSLARIYIALYNLVRVNALDREFGDRAVYLSRANALFDIFRENNGKGREPDVQFDMIHAMFALHGETGLAADERKMRICRDAAETAIGRCLRNAGRNDLTQARLCRCIADLLYPFPEPGGTYFLRFGKCIADWAAATDGRGGWAGLSEDVALERIQVMNMNSYMFLDPAYDEVIGRAFGYYSSRIGIPDGNADCRAGCLHTLGRLYDTVLQGSACGIDRTAAGRIARFMYDRSAGLSDRDDSWWYGMSYAVHWTAEQIGDRIQDEMIRRVV